MSPPTAVLDVTGAGKMTQISPKNILNTHERLFFYSFIFLFFFFVGKEHGNQKKKKKKEMICICLSACWCLFLNLFAPAFSATQTLSEFWASLGAVMKAVNKLWSFNVSQHLQ